MFILLICEVAAIITVLVLRSDVEDLVEKNMQKTMQNYGGESLVTQTWDNLQTEV